MKLKKFKRLEIKLIAIVLGVMLISPVQAQSLKLMESMDKVTVPQNRIDMRELGWPLIDVIPEDEKGITALAVAPNGYIYGGTTGYQAHLFVMNPEGALVRPLGKIPGAESIYHSLVAADDGMVYFGTSRWNKGRMDLKGKDIAKKYENFQGGHIYRLDPEEEEKNRVRTHWADPSRDCPGLTDLGIPVPGNGIHAMVGVGNELMGVSIPDAVFFVFDVKQKAVTFREEICAGPLAENPLKSISGDLIIDHDGNVWGTWDYGKFFKYIPSERRLVKLNIAVPCLKGREFMNVVDAFSLADDGTIYGGNTDGYVFSLDPKTETVKNLGKPVGQKRIRGLAAAKNGNIYGIGGEVLGVGRLFVYKPESGEFENLGMIKVHNPPYYNWMALEFDAMVAGHDGTIYIGENSRRAHLFILCPW